MNFIICDICLTCPACLSSMLPKDVYITGYARSKLSDEDLRSKVKPNLKGEAKVVEAFLKTFSYTAGAYDEPEGFQELNKKLEELEKKHSNVPVGRLFYLALPPSVYPQVLPCPPQQYDLQRLHAVP